MTKPFWIGLVLLSFGPLSVVAQAPALEIFSSPDGAFRFVYPKNYRLLVGESMLRATQGRNQGMPVCDFSTAQACVIYPIATDDQTRLEAGGFSVDTVAAITSESECSSYSDQTVRSGDRASQPDTVSINDRVFRHVSTKKTIPRHAQSADLYRTFFDRKCYELRVIVSLSDTVSLQRVARSGSLGDASADDARESLDLILSSFAFTADGSRE